MEEGGAEGGSPEAGGAVADLQGNGGAHGGGGGGDGTRGSVKCELEEEESVDFGM